jgi:protein-L-isoaspartate O-methyltransferase
MNVWAILMLVMGGLFAGAVANFAWSRVPIWRAMPRAQFVTDFAKSIAVADKVQPALLSLTIVGAVSFALTTDSTARLLAIGTAAGFTVTMLASLAILVPLQRRIIALGAESESIEAMRLQWFRGHVGRAVLSVVSLVLAAAAAVA